MLWKIKSSLQKIGKALTNTKSSFVTKIQALFSKPLSPETIDELQQILYEADLGSNLVEAFTTRIEKKLTGQTEVPSALILQEMQTFASEILNQSSIPQTVADTPHVILMVGTNGSGKTTSCAKLAHRFKREGKNVLLVAADTFRAAAIEQLTLWAERLNLPIIKGKAGGDPSAVVYDALQSALAKKVDVVIIDTAGRLESKTHLMEQLAKLRRVSNKIIPKAPHETLLVLDATTGQSAIEQTKIFHEFTPLNGIVLTKLDGTAKGGIILSIYDQMSIPVRFVGIGETIEDFSPFDPKAYVEALFAPTH